MRITTGNNNSRGSLLVKTDDTDLMRITTGDNNVKGSLLVKTGDTDLMRITTGDNNVKLIDRYRLLQTSLD
jgi:hypothetical protein